MWIIYRIRGPLDKSYVGFTSRSLWDRWIDHCGCAKRQYRPCLLHQAIYEHGETSFVLSILDQANSKQEAKQKEDFHILRLNTLNPHGYNMR
jgi:hypothetical protein